ncbi:MAG: ABC transporter ATP-binding protein [Oscillospiraceae bacterium]
MRKTTRQVVAFFYKIAWEEKPKYFLFNALAIICTAIVPFVNIIFPKYLIEELMGGKDVKLLIVFVGYIIGGNWILNSLTHIFETEINKHNDWFDRFFQKKISRKAMTMDFEHTENSKVLDQLDKAQQGMSWYSRGIGGLSLALRSFISAGITLCGIIVIIAMQSPLLLIIVLLAVLGGAFAVGRINNLEMTQFQKSPTVNRGFHYIFRELCDARYGKDIRLYGADKMMLTKAENNFYDLCEIFKALHNGSQKWGIVSAVITVAKNLLVYLYLAFLAFSKIITIGTFTMLVTSAITAKDCLQSIITELQELQKRANFMSEYKKFMEYEDALIKGDKHIVDLTDISIEFRNVSFKYPRAEEYVLKNINITINPNEHLSVVGLNGAGKTTFIKLLCRLYDVTDGEILVNDINIQDYDYAQYMKLLAVVFQDFKMFAMSIEDNIRLGSWNKEKTELSELTELCGLNDKVNSLPDGLNTLIYKYFDKSGIEPSGGEAQKLAIARALYKNAPIVVLDEPTAALDPVAEYEIYKHFDQLVGGKTAVYISHRLSSCKFCDKIAVFAENHIAEYGTHDELVKKENGIYAEMFTAQAQYYV